MRGVYLRVGLLLVLGVSLLTGAVLYLSSTAIRHGLAVETYFLDSVQGLDVGAPVKYRGVTIGQVTQIALVAAVYGSTAPRPADAMDQGSDYRAVLVRFEVDTDRIGTAPDVGTLVAEGLRVRIAPQGLTGLSYISMDFTDPAKYPPLVVPWTPRVDTIPSIPGTLSVVQDAATALLVRAQRVDFEGLASQAAALMTEISASLRDGDAHAALTQASATLAVLRGAVAAADLPGLAVDLRATLTAARTLAQGKQTAALLRDATAASARLADAAGRLPPLLARLDTVTRRADAGSADLEAALGPLLRDAQASVTSLRELSQALRRDPAQVLLQAPPPRGDRP